MAQNYTRQSSFNDGDTISASLFNDEYNQLVNAFTYSGSSDSSTGHRHDGSSGQGGNIYRIGDLDFFNKIEADSINNRWGFYVEVGGAAVEQVRIQDGAVVPVTDNDVDLGSVSLEFKDLYLDGTANIDSLVADTADINGGTVDGVVIGATTAAAITGTTLKANTSLELATGATVTAILDEDTLSSDSDTALATQQSIKAYVDAQVTAQDLDVTTDSGTIAIDLDSETLTVSGGTGLNTSATGNTVTIAIDSTVATLTGTQTLTNKTLTSPDINGGTIDGATIATSDVTVGAGKTLDVSAGTLTLANDQISGDKVEGGTIAAVTITDLASTTIDTTNIEVTNLKAKDGTSAGSIADATGVVTLASSVLTTTDINGGTIDGTDITVGAGKTLDVSAGTFTVANDQISGDAINGGTATPTTLTSTTVNATTVDTTNIEVTNLKAKDGTAAGSIADSTGVVTLASSVLTTADINGGTIDGVTIGGSSAGAITGTTGQFNTSLNVDGTVTADENITIDTSSSGNGLTIQSSGSTYNRLTFDANRVASGSILGEIMGNWDGTQVAAIRVSGGSDTTNKDDGQIYFLTDSDGTGIKNRVNIANNGDISFYEDTGTTPKLFWDASAESLGIGTTSPAEALHIAPASGNAIFRLEGALAEYWNLIGATNDKFIISNETDGNVFAIENGNVGIGTTSPGYLLHVSNSNSGGDVAASINNPSNSTNGSATLRLSTSTIATRGAFIRGLSTSASGQPTDLLFGTGGAYQDATEAMRIDSSGNVGIGTSSPSGNLHVEGGEVFFTSTTGNSKLQIKAANTAASFIEFGDSDDGNVGRLLYGHSDNSMQFTVNAAEAARIDASGNLLVGTTTSPSDTGTVVADGIYLGGTAAANQLDDYEEGTWTATWTTYSTPPTTPPTAAGFYTKVGNLVTVGVRIGPGDLSGATGAMKITGLPFTVSNSTTSNPQGSVSLYGIAFAANTVQIIPWATGNTTDVAFYSTIDSGAWVASAVTAGSGKYIELTVTYRGS